MFKKLLTVSLLVLGLCWLDACCSDKRPFFNYKTLAISSSLLYLTASADTVLALKVAPDDLEYLAAAHSNLMPAAYGGNCPQPGEDGPKFNMTSIDILADKDFNDTLPAGQSLSSLFFNGRASSTTSLPVPQIVSQLEFPAPGFDFVVYTPVKPKNSDQTFALTIRITKSDGSVAAGKIEGVKFK
ncbi:MAG: hypothetical protein IT260_12330 [Saprospiraceae bacterium]|nr:hypothetical protein [Saprospiraceae bacterium]